MTDKQQKRAQLQAAADEAINQYARREITKQECSAAQRRLMDFDDGKVED